MPIDSIRIDPGSLIITDRYGDTLRFSFNPLSQVLRLDKAPDNEPIKICFRQVYLQTHWPAIYQSTADSALSLPPALASPGLVREELFPTEGIQKTGVLSRGITFGNTQNVFVNSVLNLQMEGQLTENLNLRASITDQQVPFQPEGNTLQLREFDRVFMEIYNDKLSLTAGDVVFQNPESEFLRYYKNVQGGLLRIKHGTEGKEALSYGGVSLAKGRFVSSVVDPIEGVAGPYRLRGPGNERFVVIMANSERVYVDGQLMQRGFDFDYVIDYNLAEITFTAKVLITRFTRIRVDFEFADRNFARSILSFGHEQQLGRLKLAFNAYSEGDNRNRPLLTELSQQDMALLASVGDSISLAVRDGFTPEPFNPNAIQYVMRDTLLSSGERFEIFIRAQGPDEAVFRVAFTELGPGQGNYRLQRSTANGRVFEWVAPQNGVPTGSFEPVLRLPVPNKKEMATASIAYAFESGDEIYLETALSRQDNNLFSELDSEDNTGHALKLGFRSASRALNLWKPYTYRFSMDGEYNSAHFNFIDRLRFIEFDRDWGLEIGAELPASTENILNGGIQMRAADGSELSYSVSGRARGDIVSGWQQKLQFQEQLGSMRWRGEGFLMDNNNLFTEAQWRRGVSDWQWRKYALQPGYRLEVDRNVVSSVSTEEVIRTAMNFLEHQVYVETADTSKVQLRLAQTWRTDKLPFQGLLMDGTYAQNTHLSMQTSGKGQSLNMRLTYRKLDNLLPDATQATEETLLGRVDWLGNFFQGAVRAELSYQISDGLELQREFVFLQVPTGEGTHTWRDDNGDGIQDLNEFYEAINADEKNFIKVFVPTDIYTRAFDQIFNYRLNLSAPSTWRNAGGIKQGLAKFSFIGSYALDKKITDPDLASRLLPGIGMLDQADLLSYRQNVRSTLFFNRSAKGFAAEWTMQVNDRRQLLTAGYEAQGQNSQTMNLRYTFNTRFNTLLQLQEGTRSVSSDFLTLRNYEIDSRGLRPEVVWQPSLQARFTTAYQYATRRNVFGENPFEQVQQQEFLLDYRYTKVNATTLAATFRYVNLDFVGQENSPVGYELLQALRPGSNFTWAANITQRLFNGLQLTLSYEGRKSPEQAVIHTGRMQVSALF